MIDVASAFGVLPPGAAYAADPHPILAALRNTPPIRTMDGDVWLVARYADILSVLLAEPGSTASFNAFDTAGGDRHRGLVRRLRSWVSRLSDDDVMPAIQGVVDDLTARLVCDGTADLVRDFADRVPMAVMRDLLGIPPADVPVLETMAGRILSGYDTGWKGRSASAGPAKTMLDAYFRQRLATARKGGATPLLATILETGTADGLDDVALADICSKLLVTGTTTTAGCIANILVRRLRDGIALPSDPENHMALVDELIRLDTPVLGVRRRLLRSFHLSDGADGTTLLPKDAVVYLMTSIADRDPAIVGDVGTSCPLGSRVPHLAFGRGAFHCLGAPLARLEIAALLVAGAPLMDLLCTAGPIRWREAWLLHEPAALPVQIIANPSESASR